MAEREGFEPEKASKQLSLKIKEKPYVALYFKHKSA